ncbi:hypothetical protein AVEN_141775-1 [Araneus ventricosus]|uniref:Uncharacterized protein n=1 Tax=Araneus ventricosus TaxID=182803 RepID=A0A4Y2S568_ARAVE|nr:hypothetical protein AVEN_141775-1 [Araneus ventricosus]
MYHGDSRLDVSSGGAYHRWLALRCLIRLCVPPVARTYMSHQATRTTGGSHLDVSSGCAYPRWLALRCLIRLRVPPLARAEMSHRIVLPPVSRT